MSLPTTLSDLEKRNARSPEVFRRIVYRTHVSRGLSAKTEFLVFWCFKSVREVQVLCDRLDLIHLIDKSKPDFLVNCVCLIIV